MFYLSLAKTFLGGLPWRLIAIVAAVIVAILGGFWLHHKVYRSGYDTAIADVKRGAEKILAQQTKAVAKADQAQQDAQAQNVAKSEVLTKEVIRYVSLPNRAVCRLDAGFIGLHNASASNQAPSPASQPNAAPTKP